MKNWLKVFSIFVVLGGFLYFNSLNNKFLVDDYVFLQNPVWSSAKFILAQWNPYREEALGVMDNYETQVYYRPATHMIYDISYDLFKKDYWKYHLLNLILFVIASSLIYLLIERLTGNSNLAFLTGFLYLIHPVNGIVVNYISASVFAFQVICMLGAILLLLESWERKNHRTLYLLSVLLSFLSLFWHESGVMTLFYISAIVLLFKNDLLRKKAVILLPYFLIIAAYAIFRISFLSSDENILKQINLFHMTGWQYGANLSHVLIWYLSQLLYPSGIVMVWATPVLREHLLWYNLGLAALFTGSVFLFIKLANKKILKLALAWLVIGFAPVCLVAFRVFRDGVTIEPHWFIFSSIGFFILAASACLFVLEKAKKFGIVLIFVLIVSWVVVSHANNRLWADEKSYALYWSEKAPTLKSTFFYLAHAYAHEGSFNEARRNYRLALAEDISDLEIYLNLGVIDQAEGHLKDAESNYKMALKISPYSAAAYNNLGIIYSAEGQLEKARSSFYRSLALNPLLLEPRRGLVAILLKHEEYQKAISLCLENLDITNNDPKTLSLLIDIFIHQKDYVSLKIYAHRFIDNTTDPRVLTRLGVLMAQHNAYGLALDCFTRVLHVDPDYKDAYLAIGTLFANLGKYDEAIHLWKIGLSIDSSDQRFKESISKALAAKLKND